MSTQRLEISTTKVKQVLDVTDRLQEAVSALKLREGPCLLFVQHTTAALALGEYGEGTGEDLLETAQRMIPSIRFRHGHDPSHAPDHMASSIVGQSLTVPVVDGRLALGTWQRVLLLEFNGPRLRTVLVQAWPK